MKDFLVKHKFILFFLFCFIIFYSTFIQAWYVGWDGISIYYPVQKLLTEWNLNFWNNFNTQYGTYYFSLWFSDIAIKSFWEIYPMQPISIILFYSYFMSFLWNDSFYFINFIWVLLIILFSYLILKKLYTGNLLPIIWIILIGFISILIIWAIIPQNIIPASLFLLISIFFILKYDQTNHIKYWNLALLFLFFAILIRIIFVLFLFWYLVYFIKWNIKNVLKKIVHWFVVVIITFSFFPLSNIKYFWDFNFIWYLNNDYRPNPIWFENTPNHIINKWFTKINIENLHHILNGFTYYFKWNILYFTPLFLLVFIWFLKFPNKRFKIFFILVLIVNLLYYSNVRILLFGNETNSLISSFFRYLLPITILSFLFIPVLFQKLSKVLIYVFLFLYISVFSFYWYSYKHWASLTYYKEINTQYLSYSKKIKNIIPQWSTIFYAPRQPQRYFTDTLFDYNWFCYYCIPSHIRYQHTTDILNKFLENNERIYFASYMSPYNTLTQEMEDYLRERYIFEYVEWSEFRRENFNFYIIQSIRE